MAIENPSTLIGITSSLAVRAAFFLSAGLLALEIALTRIFSVVLWYHFGFMIVSLAMLGFALAGAAVQRRLQRGGPMDLEKTCRIAASLILPALIALTRIPFDPTLGESVLRNTLLFLAIIVLTAIPFFVMGMALCLIFEAGKGAINRVYSASFLGSALGVGIGLSGMHWLGASGGVGLAALFVWIAGCRGASPTRRFITLAIVGLPLLWPGGAVSEQSRKHFPNLSPEQVIDRQWNAYSSVAFYENPERHGLWAMPAKFSGFIPEMKGIAIDEWAITSIVKQDGDRDKLRFFNAYPPTLGLVTAKPGFDALVIGAGGGLDVLGSLYFGAAHVTAVELNPLIVEAVKGPFRKFSGDLYHDPRVTAVAAEGRLFVEQDRNRYDRIVLTGVDTFAATSAGAFALSENYIYTVEAFQAYLRHLKPGGMICMTRWFYDPPRQTLRLIAAAQEALRREGMADPAPCFFLARAGIRSLLLIKKEPFTRQEIPRLVAGCTERGALLVHGPGYQGHATIDAFFTPVGRAEMERTYPFRVDAPTDNSPFLFEHRRWRNLFRSDMDFFMDRLGGQEILLLTVLGLLGCLGLGLLVIRKIYPVRERLAGGKLGIPFLLLGVAYMVAEAALLPRLVLCLGHPVYAMSLVLVSLLVWSGLGALFARQLPGSAKAILIACLGAGLAGLACFTVGLDWLIPRLFEAAFAWKIVACLGITAIPGFLMGIPFPLAIRVFSGDQPGLVPRAFLWNGAGSALACPLAMALAITWGFTATFWFAAGIYVLGGMLLVRANQFRDQAA